MALRNRQDDLLVSKWIAAEAIHYLKTLGKLDWNFSGHFDYIGLNTKIHKIIYNVAEKNNIAITRSWYLHGGFIHNYKTLMGAEFNSFLKRYLRSKHGPVRYRSTVRELGIDTSKVLDDIEELCRFVSQMSTDEYLHYIYENEAPEKYRCSYKAKFNLTCLDSGLNKLRMHDFSSTRENSEAIRAIDRIFTDITKFEIAIFGLHEENILENNTFDFFGLVSDSLRKMKLSIMKKRSLDSIDNYFFHTILNGIINLVWKPYACEITVWTSKGIAKERAVNNAKRLKREVLVSFDNELSILRKMQKRSGLDLNWEEIKEYDALNKNVDVDRNLARLIDLYDSVGA